MLRVGFFEIVGILLVAIVLIKTEDLPKVMRAIGNLYRHLTEFLRVLRGFIRQMESGAEHHSAGTDAESETDNVGGGD